MVIDTSMENIVEVCIKHTRRRLYDKFLTSIFKAVDRANRTQASSGRSVASGVTSAFQSLAAQSRISWPGR